MVGSTEPRAAEALEAQTHRERLQLQAVRKHDLSKEILFVLPPYIALGGTPLLGGEPLSGGAAPLFAPVDHPRSPTAFWADASAPLPTNAWWENFVLDAGDQLVQV